MIVAPSRNCAVMVKDSLKQADAVFTPFHREHYTKRFLSSIGATTKMIGEKASILDAGWRECYCNGICWIDVGE
jgi:hypothetical protein